MTVSPIPASHFVVRPAHLADADAIAGVHVRSWAETYSGLIPQDVIDRMNVPDRRRAWQDILTKTQPPAHTLVAETTGGNIVGFVNGGPAREPVSGSDGEICALYVLAASQGGGIGRALFTESARRLIANGHGNFQVRVLSGNRATGFYAYMGGVPSATTQITRGGALLEETIYVWQAGDAPVNPSGLPRVP